MDRKRQAKKGFYMIIDVVDLTLKTLNFIEKYDPSRLKKAKTLYNNEDAEVTKVEKLDDNSLIVWGRVVGNYWSQYSTKLEIKGSTVNKWSCTCEDYKAGNLCKHILATSLETIEPHQPSTEEKKKEIIEARKKELEELRKQYERQQEEERKRLEYQRKYSTALNTIRRFKNADSINKEGLSNNNNFDIKALYDKVQLEKTYRNSYLPELSTQISLEPRIEISNKKGSINLGFKIGQAKKYVLKNISEFYYALINNEVIQYGKNLRFIAKKENFEENSQELLNLIINYGQMLKYSQKVNNQQNYYYSYYTRPALDSKNIYLIDEKIDDFFNIIKDNPIKVYSSIFEEQEFTLTNKNIPIYLTLKKHSENEYELKININKYDYVEAPENVYIFYENEIYKVKKSENKNLMKVLDVFYPNNKIIIPEDRIEDFKNYVIPEMSEYIQSDNLPAEVAKEGLIVNKLASKIYLDLDEDGYVTLELKFCYLDYEFNILDNYKNYVEQNKIVRNILEEKEVLKRIFEDGFEIQRGKKYFILRDEDATYEFLSEKIVQYMNDFEVLATDKFKNKKVRNTKISNVSVKLDNGLLELNLSKINISIDEIKDVLKNYNIKKKYYKLKDGDFLNLDASEDIEFLNDIQNTFDVDYSKIKDGVIKVPVNRSVYLEKLLNKNKSLNTTKNDEFTKLINNIENKNFSDNIKIDAQFENILRDYQKTGYKWLKVLESYKLGGILADDMGLRKNFTSDSINIFRNKIKKCKTINSSVPKLISIKLESRN